LVNIAGLGVMAGTAHHGTVVDLLAAPDWLHPDSTAQAADANRSAVVGIKVRLQDAEEGPRDLECLKNARQAAGACGLPLMAHIDSTYHPLPDILKMLRKGDIFTHIYNDHQHGILDANGKILPDVLEARERGVLFDPAHGNTHFSFDIAEKALQ
jgi:dihydroorotase